MGTSSLSRSRPPHPEDLVRYAAEVDGIVCHLTDRMDRAVFEAGKTGQLQVVANAAVGYDNIDVPSAQECGIAVCNTPGVLDDTTADLAFLLILAAARQSTQAEEDLRAGRWTGWGFDTGLARGRVRDDTRASSATAASAAPWHNGRPASTWRCCTRRAGTPEYPATWRPCTSCCSVRTSSASMCR